MKLTDTQIQLIDDKFSGTFYEYCEDNELKPHVAEWIDSDGCPDYEINDDALADWKHDCFQYIEQHPAEFGIKDFDDDMSDEVYDYVYNKLAR